MMKNLHYQLGYHLKLLYRININQTFNFFSTLSQALLPLEDPYLPIHDQRKTIRKLANLLQSFDSSVPLSHYKKVHAHIVLLGLQKDVFLTNMLLHEYSKGNLSDAQNLFDTMPERNLITWSSMVSMYTQHGYNEEALTLFCRFRRSSDQKPNEYILASVIRACTQLGFVSQALQIHGFIVKCGFLHDLYVGTSLIGFYSKHGDIDEARLVFCGLASKSSVTWTTIIAGYIKHGRSDVSLSLFKQMRETDVSPDRYILSSLLSACSALEFLRGGTQIHAYVLRRGIDIDASVVNGLVDFYLKCHKVKTGRKLFDQMVEKNLVTWTTMIAGYMQNSLDWDAMKLFLEMANIGWKPDAFACTSILTSCGSLEALEMGRQVHAYTIKANLENDDFVKNGLVDMYAKCNSLTDARKVFDLMAGSNVVSYNAMIEGYCKQEKPHEALDLFLEMRLSSSPPTLLTFVSLLGLCASLFYLKLSNQIHCTIIKCGFSLDIFAGSSLIDVYSKCSLVRDAKLVFEETHEKDVVVWNAMFSGFTQNMEYEESLKIFKDLQLSKIRPNEFTFAAVIAATSNLASLHHGQQIHGQVIKTGLESDPFVSNALVDMYAKCGNIREAHQAFSSTTVRDVACWNSMISTYAQHGEAKDALRIFDDMIKEGAEPNYVTFVGVLSACSHAGFVDLGFHHFKLMAAQYGIEPGMEHYACMVSLLGRAGRVYEAKEFIETMPIKPEAVVWRSLLSACRFTGHIELGIYAAEMAITRDPEDSGSYTMLSNLFASKGMWLDVRRVREKMDTSGVMKEPGCSWIEVNNEVHLFIARDTSHRDTSLIASVLDNLILHIKGHDYESDSVTDLDQD